MRLYRNHSIDLLRKSMEWFLYSRKYHLVCVKPTVIYKIFGTNCSFHVRWRATGKVKFMFFKSFLIVTINKIFILVGRLNNGLLFYRVFWLSWYFLLYWDPRSFCVCVWERGPARRRRCLGRSVVQLLSREVLSCSATQ